MDDIENPFGEEDEESTPPPSWPCPKCGEPAYLSYYLCDVEPYPFDGTLKECHTCDHMWVENEQNAGFEIIGS